MIHLQCIQECVVCIIRCQVLTVYMVICTPGSGGKQRKTESHVHSYLSHALND